MKTIKHFLKKLQFVAIGATLLSAVACKKVLNVPLPANVVLVNNAYLDDGTATAAVQSMYSQMIQHNNFEWGGITINSSMYADDIDTYRANNFYLANVLSVGSESPSMMSEAYRTVLYANTSIQELLASTSLTLATRQELLGECYFVRAYTYFYIVNYWGSAAALELKTDVATTQVAPSTAASKIYDQIIADLKIAQSDLTNTYPASDKGRPNVQAANALLARVYLYTGKYTDAITQASAVVNSGLYTPLPSTSSNFLISSSETIWSLQAQLIGGQLTPTPDGYQFISTNTFSEPVYVISSNLLAAFEPGDLRLTNWVMAVPTSFGGGPVTTYYVPGKYKQHLAASRASVTENYVMLRAAEMYLILAEAYYKKNDIPNAASNLNVVRARAGLAGLPTTMTADQCRAAIEQENRVEFFAEQGHRFLDLKRWPGIAGGKQRSDEVLPVTKAAVTGFNWSNYKNLFPIGYQDLLTDKNLVQNPGY
jgi:hypothetical protein